MIHESHWDIAWGDMDALGHVNNARFFEYFQNARIQWLGELGFHLPNSTGPVVAQISCNFHAPLHSPARICIRSWFYDPGHSSIGLAHELHHEQTCIANGDSRLVWLDYARHQSIPIPDAIRNCVESKD